MRSCYSLKDEMNEISESNQRMGQKIAVLISENQEKDRDIRKLQEVHEAFASTRSQMFVGWQAIEDA